MKTIRKVEDRKALFGVRFEDNSIVGKRGPKATDEKSCIKCGKEKPDRFYAEYDWDDYIWQRACLSCMDNEWYELVLVWAEMEA